MVHSKCFGLISRPRLLTTAAIVLTILCLGGCLTLDQIAPPVDPPLAQAAQRQGYTVADITHGRQLYITACAKCHAAEPVDRYPAQAWPQIVQEMRPRAGLTPQEAQTVEAYVLAVHSYLDGQQAGNAAAPTP